jgi:hypothetical protein
MGTLTDAETEQIAVLILTVFGITFVVLAVWGLSAT